MIRMVVSCYVEYNQTLHRYTTLNIHYEKEQTQISLRIVFLSL